MLNRFEPRLDYDLNNYLHNYHKGKRPVGVCKEFSVMLPAGWKLILVNDDGSTFEYITQYDIPIGLLLSRSGVMFNVRTRAWEIEYPVTVNSLEEIVKFIMNYAQETGYWLSEGLNGMRI